MNNSTWQDYYKIYSIDTINNVEELNSDKIFNRWNKFSEDQRQAIKPLLDEIIVLSNNFRETDLNFGEEVSDSIYAMF